MAESKLAQIKALAFAPVGISVLNRLLSFVSGRQPTTPPPDRAYLERIIDSMGNSLIVLGTDGCIKTVNQATLNMLGYSEAELLGKPVNVLFADGTFYGSGIDTIYKHGSIRRGERTYRTRDGRTIPVWFSGEAMHDSHGRLRGIVCVAQDISSRMQMENAVRVSEDRFRSVLENAADIIFMVDANGNLVSLNPAFEQITGWSREMWLNKPLSSLLEDDSLTMAADMMTRGLKGETIRNCELSIRSHTGQTVIGEFAVTPLYRDGAVSGMLGIVRDVTARKHAETELQKHVSQLKLLQRVDAELTHSLDTATVMTLALDIATRTSGAKAGWLGLVYENRLVHAVSVGYPEKLTAESPNLAALVQLFLKRPAQLFLESERKVVFQGLLEGTTAQMVIPLVSHDRMIGVLSLESDKADRFTQEVFDFVKLITMRIAVALDNSRLYETTRRHLGELQQLYRHVSELEQLKTDMIRIAAHDLRNPLSAIQLSLQLLERMSADTITPQQAAAQERIRDSAQRMMNIVNNILSLERIEQSVNGDSREAIDLREVARKAFDHASADARMRQLQYVMTAPDSPLIVQGDAVELEEAVTNLIGNAIKYTPTQGQVTIRLSACEKRAVLEVEDTGPGVPEEQQAKLFLPFSRAGKQGQTDGFGLGLHLVKKVIERHHGEIRFRSQPGQGSTFGFELPLVSQSPQ